MARWVYHNPSETAPESEQRTARLLGNLSDEFTVRWSFYYTSKKYGIFREGNFVIQGPGGHIFVMEAKGGEPSCDPHTGEWNMGDGRNPYRQLDAACAGRGPSASGTLAVNPKFPCRLVQAFSSH